MEHKGTVTIETDRLCLRAFELKDIQAAFRNWTSDERVTEFLRWPTHTDISITEKVIKDWIEESKKPDFYQWAIVLKDIDEPIGTISVVDKNEALNILHIGYCIGSKWWHRGITSEAFAAIILYLFEEVGANRIESQHDPNNPHSGNVMKKCGLVYEGTLRQADFSNKGIVDACMYSLLKEEWKNKKGSLQVNFYDKIEDELLKFAVIISKHKGKWVFCKHKERDTYEIPGGRREPGETIFETAKRELQEETGALEFQIFPVCVYSVIGKTRVNQSGKESYGMLYFADIQSFEKELHSEIECVNFFEDLPTEWTYPKIQPLLIKEYLSRLENQHV